MKIIGITETWFKSWIPKFDNYIWAHNIRKGAKGGGVSFLIEKNLYEITNIEETDQNNEMIWISLDDKINKSKIRIGLMYAPQENDKKSQKIENVI